jgi:hypothetical protein
MPRSREEREGTENGMATSRSKGLERSSATDLMIFGRTHRAAEAPVSKRARIYRRREEGRVRSRGKKVNRRVRGR